MKQNGKIEVYVNVMPDGNKSLRLVGKHITEDIKNDILEALGYKAKCIKVVVEECDSICQNFHK